MYKEKTLLISKPLFFAFVLYMAGVFFADYVSYESVFARSQVFLSYLIEGFFAACFLGIYLLRNKKSKWISLSFNTAISLVFFLLGVLNVFLLSPDFIKHSEDKSEVLAIMRLRECPTQGKNSLRARAEVEALQYEDRIIPCDKLDILLYFPKQISEADKLVYQRIYAKIRISPIENFDTHFDYRRYMYRKQLRYSAYVSENAILRLDSIGWRDFSVRAQIQQKKFSSYLSQCGLDEQEAGIAAAMLLGDSEAIDPDLKKAYRVSGAVHILCVSGLHVGIFALLLSKILFFLKRKAWQRWLKFFLLFFILFLYSAITGFSPPVLRAVIMFLSAALAYAMNKKTKIFQSLLVSAFLISVLNPFVLFSVGFLFSYAAVIGIVLLSPLSDRLKKLKKSYAPIRYVGEISFVSVGAQVFTAPIMLYAFGTFPVYFLLSNYIASPISILIIPMGLFLFVYYACAQIFTLPGLEIFGNLYNALIRLLNQSICFVEGLPFAEYKWSITFWEMLFVYLAFYCVYSILIKRKKEYIYLLFICLIIVCL